jgi:hypothetical protein
LWNDLGGPFRRIKVGKIAWSSVEVVRQARDGCVVVAYRGGGDAMENLVFWPRDPSGMTAAAMVQELSEFVRSVPQAPGPDDTGG